MKQTLVLLLLLIGFNSYSQNWPKIWIPSSVTKDINGGTISKGDTVDVVIEMNRNYNDQEPLSNQIRSILFDFQHQNDAFKLIDMIVPTIGSGAIPNTNYSISKNEYPGYNYLESTLNTTTNGNTNYNYSNYAYSPTSVKQITRVSLNINANLGNGVIFILRFIALNPNAGYVYDPLKMNFAACFTTTSGAGGSIMTNKICSFILDPTANSLLTLKMENNSNLDMGYMPKVYIGEYAQDGITQVDVKDFNIASDGTVNVDQSWLKTNTNYFIMPWAPLDSAHSIQDKAVTVSDFTAAQTEFINQNLDKTYSNSNMQTGMSYYASDVDKNQIFDAADVNKIFAQVTGAGYLLTVNQANSYNNSVFTFFTDSMYNNLKTTNWFTINSWKVNFKTSSVNQNVNLKYSILGDINRSHSSQVITTTGQIISNRIANNSNVTAPLIFINTPNEISNIDVNLNNVTVTSDNIEIPFKVDSKTNKTSALQFEIVYDATKIKFEEIKSELPNTWFVFVNPTTGKVKFGAIDKDLKTPITGATIPFKLRFSSIGSGVDVLSQIKITSNMDASDNKGNQLGINLNIVTIKLTGYNKF
jgi:hypothetical protein